MIVTVPKFKIQKSKRDSVAAAAALHIVIVVVSLAFLPLPSLHFVFASILCNSKQPNVTTQTQQAT